MNTGSRGLLREPLWWIVAGVAARHAVGAWQLRRSLAYLAQGRPPVGGPAGPLPRLHLVVPVLREQPHVAAMLAWFATLARELAGVTLTVVTTEQETRERTHLVDLLVHAGTGLNAHRIPQLSPAELHAVRTARTTTGPLTHAVVAQALARFPSTATVVDEQLRLPEYRDLPIRHVHYQGRGRKAAQVNYAATQLDGTAGDYLVVYDVDSRPTAALLHRTRSWVAGRRAGGAGPAVVQQPARFTTAGQAPTGWERAACRGSARLQTLWTLRREIPAFRRYTAAVRRPTGHTGVDAVRRGLAQTVGHGLLIRLDVFGRVGGLPEFTTLDDLPFGYRLTVDRIHVEVLPTLTLAAAPDRVRDLLALKRRWYANYLDYPRCAAAARRAGVGTATEHAVALLTAAYRGATWALATPATAVCLTAVVGRRVRWPVRATAAAAVWLGCVTPVRVLAAADGHRPRAWDQARDSVEVLAAYLLHSLGPLAAIAGAAAGRRRTRFTPKTNHRPGGDPS